MRHTHSVCPLLAYDEAGKLIPPVDYRAILKGATAAIAFDLAHWSFSPRDGRPGSDTFVASIRRIDVLRRAAPEFLGAPKHVLDMLDPLPSTVSLGKRAKRE